MTTSVAKKTTAIPTIDFDQMGDLSDLLNNDPVAAPHQGPIQFDINKIKEDPNQPRESDNPGFSEESINDLAVTIKRRGVKTPISVRIDPDQAGNFIINHGARRYRGSVVAEMKTIPGFIDNDYEDDDAMVENIQRDDFTPREIANYIGRKLAEGIKQYKIAQKLGKSKGYVSQYAILLDLPEPVANVFNNGRTSDVTLIHELAGMCKKNPEEVSEWLLNEDQEINRTNVKLFKQFLLEQDLTDKRSDAETPADDDTDAMEDDVSADTEDSQGDAASQQDFVGGTSLFDNAETPADDDTDAMEDDVSADTEDSQGDEGMDLLVEPVIIVELDGRKARLILSIKPKAKEQVWLIYIDEDENDLGEKEQVFLADLDLLALVEGE